MKLLLDAYGTQVVENESTWSDEHENKHLYCLTTTEGKPKNIIQYQWFKDGRNIADEDRIIIRNAELDITVITR